ncbi:MAG: YihY/virulence factor BrkB family protein [Hyphomicrobiales bacterium]
MADLRRPGLGVLVLGAAVGGLALAFRPERLNGGEARDRVKRVRAIAPSQEGGRGRAASSPWRIPWKGWKDILWRTYQEIQRDRLLAVAAGVVFFGLLAFFPTVTAFVSLYGLFVEPGTIREHLDLAASVMPAGAVDILREQVERIVSKPSGTLGFAFIVSLGLALWSSNSGMKAVIDALNVAYEEDEKRSFIRLNLISLAFTIGGLIALLLALSAVVIFPLVLAAIGLNSWVSTIIWLVRWPILLVFVILGLAVLYRYGPSRREPKWEWVTPGSLFAATAWIGGSLLLSWYLQNFADYNATYGSLGAAIGFMMWLWVSSIVILLGAELNSEIEHQTARDSTRGPVEKPLGARGATMADTIGKAQFA